MNHNSKPVRAGFLLLDLVCVLASFISAIVLRFGSLAGADRLHSYMLLGASLLAFTIFYNLMVGNGRGFLRRGYYVEIGYCLRHVILLGIFCGFAIFFMKIGRDISRLVFGYLLIMDLMLMYLYRSLLKLFFRIVFKGKTTEKQVIAVFSSSEDADKCSSIKNSLSYERRLVDTLYWDQLGGPGALIEALRTREVDEVLLMVRGLSGQELNDTIMGIVTMGVACFYSIDIPGLDISGAGAGSYAGLKVLSYDFAPQDEGRMLIKRLMDLAGGLLGLTLTAIMYPFIALAIKIDSPGPVVFSQVRIGRNGRRFKIYKFRSMYIDAEERKKELESQNEMKGLMFKMENDPRITPVGSFIRKTSLDEFPQFLNVIRGEMSLVGTRPPTEDEFNRYTPYHRRRLCRTPGLTGLWQVSGRSEVKDFDQVVALDLEYIDNWSLGLDIKILLQTVGVVIFGRGAS